MVTLLAAIVGAQFRICREICPNLSVGQSSGQLRPFARAASDAPGWLSLARSGPFLLAAVGLSAPEA
jgi:hypothetical protein